MKKFIVAVLTCTSVFLGSPVSVAETDLATELRRVIDGLSSPDPIARLVAFDEGVSSSKSIVRQKAIELALTSSDADLRTLAVENVLATKSTHILTIEPNGETNDHAFELTAGSVDFKLLNFDQATGDFLAASSGTPINGDVLQTRPGNWSAGRLSFGLNLGATSFRLDDCNVMTQLHETNTELVGVMRCTRLTNNVRIDLLK